jgi:hypothetical protein
MEENWRSLEVHLSDEEEAQIRRFVENAEIAGPYMPPAFANYNYSDTQEEN